MASGRGDTVGSGVRAEVEPRIKNSVEVHVVHAGHLLSDERASASRAARIAERAPCSRDRTVPTGMSRRFDISS